MNDNFDIIGDIHGCADKLEALLLKLDYEKQNGYYQHPERRTIFLGDFIDRGPEQKRTLELVRPMIDSGKALSVMGNHEFNAICYATQTDNGYVRPHSDKNTGQHKEFLKEFPFGSPEFNETISWFKSLPVSLDLEEIGVVHACWCTDSLQHLDTITDDTGCLKENAYLEYADKGTSSYRTLEKLLKGPEHELPEALYFHDKDGNLRKNARISWWVHKDEPIAERLEFGGAELSEAQIAALNEDTAPPEFPLPEKLVFIGHYWLKGTPTPLSKKVACVDYSVAKEGKMTAYQWDGEKEIQPQKFIWV